MSQSKGFRKTKQPNKRAVNDQNEILRSTLESVKGSVQFLGSQVWPMMQKIQGLEKELASVGELLRKKEKQGAIESGDSVMVDFSGVLKETGKPFTGSLGYGNVIALGSGTFLEEFEKGIIGMSIGETKEINVTFSEEYAKKLEGSSAIFTVKVVKAWEKLPQDNDDIINLHKERLKEQEAVNEQTEQSKEA